MANFTKIDLRLLYKRETGKSDTIGDTEIETVFQCESCGNEQDILVTAECVPDSDYVEWLEEEFIKLKQNS